MMAMTDGSGGQSLGLAFSALIWLGTLGAGAIAGGFASWMVARRWAYRGRLEVSLSVASVLDPPSLGLGAKIRLKGRDYPNIHVLELVVRNPRFNDVQIEGAADASEANSIRSGLVMPRLDFKDADVIAVQTPKEGQEHFWVPLSRKPDQVFINVHNVQARHTARLTILVSMVSGSVFTAANVVLDGGRLPDTDVIPKGILAS